MSEYTTANIGRSGTGLRTPSDPPVRPDGKCALDGCGKTLPKLAVVHRDPFHSSKCCRVFYGLRESMGSGTQGWKKSEPIHGSTRYRLGCRCDTCRAEASIQRRNYRNPARDAARKRERYATDPEYREKVLTRMRNRKRGKRADV